MVKQANNQFEFGTTAVSAHRRELIHGGKRVDIGNRAFDLLLLLIEERGTAVSKDRIMETVWRGRIVGENALEAQVSSLRRALSDDRNAILTIAGRGYQFVGLLRPQSESSIQVESALIRSGRDGLRPQIPTYNSRSFGRESDGRTVARMLETMRLVTLIGAGGVGKTRLAVETVHQIAHRFPDGVCMVQAGSVTSRDELPSLIASALLSCSLGNANCLHMEFERIKGKRILLLFDNCEHLLGAISGVIETLLETTSSVHILTTSREALRIPHEGTFQVAPLEVPPDEENDEVGQYASVALLLDRVGENFDTSDRKAMRAAARICNSLDGLPLAIELSAECVPALGVEGIAEHLHNRFELLTHGARTAPARHKTLRASIDWSYEPLSELCKAVLNRLSVFEDTFTLNAAHRMVSCSGLSTVNVTSSIIELVDKSLVTPMPQSNPVMYRLSNTVRAYANDRLKDSCSGRQWLRSSSHHVGQDRHPQPRPFEKSY